MFQRPSKESGRQQHSKALTWKSAKARSFPLLDHRVQENPRLLNLIAGLDRPTTGDIRIEGQSLSTLSDDELTRVRRDKIGFIFQFFNLLPTLNCVENVALPLHLRGWPRRKIQERARELLEMVKLDHRLEHLPEELSGGERQRVAIARALSVYPPVFLPMNPPAISIRGPARTS